jgi:nucleotide-binding universal stress UspA family protein
MKNIYKILVPTDFTSVAETALKNAVQMASIMEGEIVVLHVVEKQEEVIPAQQKVDVIVNKINTEYNIPTAGKTVQGNIFEDIGNVAKNEGAKLIIMGTHGRKGVQHLTGSYAMKVITGSEIPFIVVQDKEVPESYKNIVFPIDFKAETKIKITLTASMAQKLGAKIHIFGEYVDDQFQQKKVENNISFAKKFFEEQQIPFTVEVAKEEGNFVKQILRYGASINADLLAILNLDYRSISHFLKNKEEELITNDAQIPVLMVNPSESFLNSSLLFGAFQNTNF